MKVYRVVSDRRKYGEFTNKEEAEFYRETLTEASSFNYYSNEYFYIEEDED